MRGSSSCRIAGGIRGFTPATFTSSTIISSSFGSLVLVLRLSDRLQFTFADLKSLGGRISESPRSHMWFVLYPSSSALNSYTALISVACHTTTMCAMNGCLPWCCMWPTFRHRCILSISHAPACSLSGWHLKVVSTRNAKPHPRLVDFQAMARLEIGRDRSTARRSLTLESLLPHLLTCGSPLQVGLSMSDREPPNSHLQVKRQLPYLCPCPARILMTSPLEWGEVFMRSQVFTRSSHTDESRYVIEGRHDEWRSLCHRDEEAKNTK